MYSRLHWVLLTLRGFKTKNLRDKLNEITSKNNIKEKNTLSVCCVFKVKNVENDHKSEQI